MGTYSEYVVAGIVIGVILAKWWMVGSFWEEGLQCNIPLATSSCTSSLPFIAEYYTSVAILYA